MSLLCTPVRWIRVNPLLSSYFNAIDWLFIKRCPLLCFFVNTFNVQYYTFFLAHACCSTVYRTISVLDLSDFPLYVRLTSTWYNCLSTPCYESALKIQRLFVLASYLKWYIIEWFNKNFNENWLNVKPIYTYNQMEADG